MFDPYGAAAQEGAGLRVTGQAIVVHTGVNPVPGGAHLEETRVVQPVLVLNAWALGGTLSLSAVANLEGWTIPEGELTPGAFGEGFVDRRHPHTYYHEVMLSATDFLGRLDGPVRLSLSGGKGFATFGTDDPMSRPVVRYPVNHHFAQVLERVVGAAGIAWGPLMLEASLFNGDEPERPEQWPLLDRFGDSWAARLTVRPLRGLELQGSTAEVFSPEHRPGAGLKVSKRSLSARYDGPLGGIPVYGLAEWAESSEAERFFVFDSYLVELEARPGRHRGYFRAERTERPEEHRTLSRFRTVRPHTENVLIGITLWNVYTGGYGATLGPFWSGLRVEPFAEVTRASVSRVGGGLFRPELFYGDTSFWALSAGLRLDWGMRGHRMGRYGVAASDHHSTQGGTHAP